MLKRVVRKGLKITLSGNEPDFIIVGAQKSGTTSLHYYLDQHPDLVGSTPKEVGYFHNERNYKKGRSWYKKAFINYSNPLRKGLYFEATPLYLYRTKIPARIYDFNPSLKIIILLREPTNRAYSAWNMYRKFRYQEQGLPEVFYIDNELNLKSDLIREFYQSEEFPTFEQVIQSEMRKIKSGSKQEEPGLIRRGIYLPQIKRYHELFGKDHVLILGFKDLIKSQIKTLNKILTFLELPENDWKYLNHEKRNVNKYPVNLLPETEQFLKDFYQPYNEELFSYLGYQPDW